MASNKSLAEFNLTFEPKLQAGKAALMELYEQARGVTDEMETRRAQLGIKELHHIYLLNLKFSLEF